MDRQTLESHLAAGLSLEQIGREVHRHPSTVAYWLCKYGLHAAQRDKHLAKGAVVPEDLRRLVAAGLTQRALAAELGVSQTTVRHWLTRLGLKTAQASAGRRSVANSSDRSFAVAPAMVRPFTCLRLAAAATGANAAVRSA